MALGALAVVAPVTAGAAASGPPGRTATDGTTVSYRGWTGRAPAGWAVIDLAVHPTACVRFDVHAVYLGHPGGQQACPSHVSGRTTALLIEPIEDLTASADLTSRTAAVPSLPGIPLSAQQARVAVPTAGVLLTATWGTDRLAVDRLLATATATPGWQPAPSTYSRPATRSQPQTQAQPRTAKLASGPFKGEAFDACTAPSKATMSAWLASPYRAVGIYIGGANRACSQANLTADWIRTVTGQGWRLVPIYVGRQAPIPICHCLTIDPGQATTQGRLAADDAVNDARSVAIGPGATLFNDMEGYTRGSTNTGPVMRFLSGWSARLHELGYRSGVYSGSTSGIRDLVELPLSGSGLTLPDVVWYAYWDGRDQTTNDQFLPASRWTHERMHQYQTGTARWGGVTIDIDRSAVDAHLAGPVGTPPRPPPPPPPPVPGAVARTFVQRAYSVALGRAPSAHEADFWTWCVSFGCSRAAFLRSLLSTRAWAARMTAIQYLTVLRRAPDPTGASYWTRWLMGPGQPDLLASHLAASTERWKHSGNNTTAYVRGLYRDILRRTPSPSREAYWIRRLRSGTSRAAVAAAFTTGGLQVSRFVTSAFRGLLGRSPDPRGLTYWSNVYKKGFDPTSVLVPLGASNEAVKKR